MGVTNKAVLSAILLLIGGCNGSAAAEATLPDGETDSSCAALIFAATNLLDDKGVTAGGFAGFEDYVAIMTKYGTAYAKSKSIDADEALGEIKLEAYRMTGTVPGADVVLSTDSIVSRAKACMGPKT